MNPQNKLALIIFFISLTLPLILFHGAIDDFGPRHMANINEISFNGYLSQYDDSLPGYYTYGVMISKICGVSSKDLLFMPIQLIPFAISFFFFINLLSRNYLFASIVTANELITGVTGSPKIYFWPHGLGLILFYTILAIFLRMFEDENENLPMYIFILVTVGSSLVYLSYDTFAVALLFIGLASILLFLFSRNGTNPNFKQFRYYSKKLSAIFLILVIVELGLSKFFYNTFLEIFFHINYIEISGMDKLLISIFGHENSALPFYSLLLKYPMIITFLNMVKYFILFISVLTILYYIVNKFVKNIKINSHDIFILTAFLMTIIYSIIRLHIGQNIVTYLYFPGIVCLVSLNQFLGKSRNWAKYAVLSLFAISICTYYIMEVDGLLNQDSNNYDYLEAPSNWYIDHGSMNVFSDELSHGFFMTYFSEKNPKFNENGTSIYMDELAKKIKVMTTQDAIFLTNESTNSQLNHTYLINYNLNSMNLQNWIIIKSWVYSKAFIESNRRINKIYDVSSVSIYAS